VPPAKQPDGVKSAKSLKALQATGNWLQDLLPQDVDNTISTWFRNRRRNNEEQQEPPDAPPDQKSEQDAPVTTGSVRQGSAAQGYRQSDRTDMRQLIDATRR
jgi:hypothetical protein